MDLINIVRKPCVVPAFKWKKVSGYFGMGGDARELSAYVLGESDKLTSAGFPMVTVEAESTEDDDVIRFTFTGKRLENNDELAERIGREEKHNAAEIAELAKQKVRIERSKEILRLTAHLSIDELRKATLEIRDEG